MALPLPNAGRIADFPSGNVAVEERAVAGRLQPDPAFRQARQEMAETTPAR